MEHVSISSRFRGNTNSPMQQPAAAVRWGGMSRGSNTAMPDVWYMEQLEWLFVLVRGGHPDPHLQRRVRNLGGALRRRRRRGRRPKALHRTPLRVVVLRGCVPTLAARGCPGIHGVLQLYVPGWHGGIQQSMHARSQLTNLLPPGAAAAAVVLELELGGVGAESPRDRAARLRAAVALPFM